MKLRLRRPHLRYAAWAASASILAVAATLLAEPNRGGIQETSHRKSTDAPVAATGKLGQDLFLAIDHRSLTDVKALLKKGAEVNARNGLEFTPLYIAAASHQTDVMQVLIDAGATIDAKSAYGTPLSFSAAYANVSGTMLLIAHSADVNTVRSDGMTVLMQAANVGVPVVVAELIKRKADVNATDDDGRCALSYAALNGNLEAGRLLLRAGAAVDKADGSHETPLMAAAVGGHADFAKMLLQRGANPNARDSKGRTALLLASAYGGYADVAKVLLKGGADPKIAETGGGTAADLAAERGFQQCSALLGKTTASSAWGNRTPREAAKLSLKLVQSSMVAFHKATSCVSCHQEGLGRMATGAAQAHGIPIDATAESLDRQRIDGMEGALQPLHTGALRSPEVMKQVPLIEISEVSTAYSWLLNGMVAHNEPVTPGAAAMALVLARQQAPDGSWKYSVPREPMQSSYFTFTALSARALECYVPKANAKEVAERTARAKDWLIKTPAKNTEDRAFKLLGLKWTSATKSKRAKASSAVLADQRSDGGWAQLPNLQSDAYSTGEALYALREGGGLSVNSEAYKRGVSYLLRTQDSDGSWFVAKRAIAANNYLDAGFPNGVSQYASFNGTCWATMALLETVNRG